MAAHPVPGLEAASIVSSAGTVVGNLLAAGLSDGRASLMQVRFVPQYDGAVLRDLSIEVRERASVALDPSGRPLRQVSYAEQDDQKFAAGLVADDEVSYWWIDSGGTEHRASLRSDPPDRITHVRIGRNGSVVAGTDRMDATALTDYFAPLQKWLDEQNRGKAVGW